MAVPSFEQGTPQSHHAIERATDTLEADRHYLEKLRSVHNFGDAEENAQAPASLFRPSQKREEPIEDDMVQQLLSTEEADGLINLYRQMSVSFPFVIVPFGISAKELHASRPMLFLAILTVSSFKDHGRQMSLDAIYRKQLASRTIIHPRRTLGLVQSVLVYLSW